MPNHFHLLIVLQADGLGRRGMRAFGSSYSKSDQHGTGSAGALFQGWLKGKHIEKDEYLLHLSRYIHRNPIEPGLVKLPQEWI